MKEVISKSQFLKFYPHKIYCYATLISTIQRFVLRPGFLDMCETTRNFYSNRFQNQLSDVYHGNIWSEFLTNMTSS